MGQWMDPEVQAAMNERFALIKAKAVGTAKVALREMIWWNLDTKREWSPRTQISVSPGAELLKRRPIINWPIVRNFIPME